MKRALKYYRIIWFKHDLAAGLSVFLVALPLCLGIALASGAPLYAGILSGIIGGLVVSLLSGSPLAVSGPAAGLSTMVGSGDYFAWRLQTFFALCCNCWTISNYTWSTQTGGYCQLFSLICYQRNVGRYWNHFNFETNSFGVRI